jgi:hypothetical protein
MFGNDFPEALMLDHLAQLQLPMPRQWMMLSKLLHKSIKKEQN